MYLYHVHAGTKNCVVLRKGRTQYADKYKTKVQKYKDQDFCGWSRMSFAFGLYALDWLWHEVHYLPDEIKTFEDMLENKYFMLIHVYTTQNLSNFTRDDFSKSYHCYESYDEAAGSVVFVQLKDDSGLKALQRDINSITFEYEDNHARVYDNDTNAYVDAFKKYQIQGALYLDKTKFVYND